MQYPGKIKAVDNQVFLKFCKGCLIWEQKREHSWKETHVCKINHYQSSVVMESAGAISILSSSIEKYNVRYSHCTEPIKEVVDSKPYGDDIKTAKLGSVRHLQKRLGTRIAMVRALMGKRD